MTGQSLLNLMEIANPELQLQSGEDDVTRGLLALNVAQDMFETIAARYPNFLGSHTSTVTTSANTETTTYPTGLLRLDGMDYIDPSTSRPAWDLVPLYKRGGHATYRYWPLVMLTSSTSGKPRGYWTNGTSIYWQPLPDGTHTVRWYGLQAQTDITAGGTFLYPDAVAFPLALMAAKIIKVGLDDDPAQLNNLAEEIFEPLIDNMSKFRREEGRGLIYSRKHDT